MAYFKGVAFGLFVIMALIAMKYSWGLSIDIRSILMFIFGLAPILLLLMVVGYIGNSIFGKQDKQ
tara:strand:- start:17408 stop:17602 length:195 start_codon:yes stop_codon:yes gene_type:complete